MTRRKRTRNGDQQNAGKASNLPSTRTKTYLFATMSATLAAMVGAIIAATIFLPGNRTSNTREETHTSQVPTKPPEPAGASISQPDPSTSQSAPNAETTETGPALRAEIETLEREALDAINQLIETLPTSSDPLALMGMVHVNFGNTDEAIVWWEKALKANSKRPDVYDGMAQVAAARGEYQKAVELWRKVLQIAPGLPDMRNKLAGALIDSGKADEALVVLEEELEISARPSAAPLILLGKAHLQLRDYEKARNFYAKAVEIDADYADAWYGLATSQARLGEGDNARRSMDKFNEVMAADQRADLQRKTSLDDLSTIRGYAAEAHTGVGLTYRSKGYPAKAEACWRRAAELAPADIASRVHLATLYLDGGKYDKALPLCEQLVELAPKNAGFHMNLGMVYSRVDRIDASMAEVRRAMELEPDNEGFRKLYRQLQESKQREPRK